MSNNIKSDLKLNFIVLSACGKKYFINSIRDDFRLVIVGEEKMRFLRDVEDVCSKLGVIFKLKETGTVANCEN